MNRTCYWNGFRSDNNNNNNNLYILSETGPLRYVKFILQYVLTKGKKKSLRPNKYSQIIGPSTSNNQGLGSGFDDLDPRLSLLCQVGDDLIHPCKIYGGCQIRIPRSIHSFVD